MRASNLQDLVYKNGQAGITKATVSITFDNSNKSQSPLGFETHDEITVTRQVDNLILIFIFILVLSNCVNQTSPCSNHSLNLMYVWSEWSLKWIHYCCSSQRWWLEVGTSISLMGSTLTTQGCRICSAPLVSTSTTHISSSCRSEYFGIVWVEIGGGMLSHGFTVHVFLMVHQLFLFNDCWSIPLPI